MRQGAALREVGSVYRQERLDNNSLERSQRDESQMQGNNCSGNSGSDDGYRCAGSARGQAGVRKGMINAAINILV